MWKVQKIYVTLPYTAPWPYGRSPPPVCRSVPPWWAAVMGTPAAVPQLTATCTSPSRCPFRSCLWWQSPRSNPGSHLEPVQNEVVLKKLVIEILACLKELEIYLLVYICFISYTWNSQHVVLVSSITWISFLLGFCPKSCQFYSPKAKKTLSLIEIKIPKCLKELHRVPSTCLYLIYLTTLSMSSHKGMAITDDYSFLSMHALILLLSHHKLQHSIPAWSNTLIFFSHPSLAYSRTLILFLHTLILTPLSLAQSIPLASPSPGRTVPSRQGWCAPGGAAPGPWSQPGAKVWLRRRFQVRKYSYPTGPPHDWH